MEDQAFYRSLQGHRRMRRRCAISRPRSFSGTALDRVQVVAFAADRRLDRGGASEMVLRSGPPDQDDDGSGRLTIDSISRSTKYDVDSSVIQLRASE
jgi:hypothetical protein